MTGLVAAPLEYQLIGLAESGDVGNILSTLDQKQGRVRLQALIAEWLRVDNLIVLTGSGTSVSSGGKTMANLETAVFATIEALADRDGQVNGPTGAMRSMVCPTGSRGERCSCDLRPGRKCFGASGAVIDG